MKVPYTTSMLRLVRYALKMSLDGPTCNQQAEVSVPNGTQKHNALLQEAVGVP